MILLLATDGDPLRQLLPAALLAATPERQDQVLAFDPATPGDLALKLSAEDGVLSGRFRNSGEIYDWSAVEAAWVADSGRPELGSAYELLLEGLDLASFPVVARPRVRETLACASNLDQLAQLAGLERPNRSWLAAGPEPGQPAPPHGDPESTVSLWRGGKELHGAPPAVRPWITAIARFADEAHLLWGRIDLEPQIAGPPLLLGVVQSCPPAASLAELPDAPRQALFALAEHLCGARQNAR